jgi:hypothetical protein
MILSRLEKIKKDIASFSDKTFGTNRSFAAPLEHLKEEVQEVIDSNGDIDEYADCMLLLLDSFRMKYPNLSTKDLLKQCKRKLKVCEQRKWGKPDSKGVVRHIK